MTPSRQQLKEVRSHLKQSRICTGLVKKLDSGNVLRLAIAAQSMIELGHCFNKLAIAKNIEERGF